jgi:hypothetical protein
MTDYIETVKRVLGEELANAVLGDTAFPALSKTLARLEAAGRNPGQLLRQAAQRHELDTAASTAKVLNHRIQLMTAVAGVDNHYSQRGSTPTSMPAHPLRSPTREAGLRR